MSRRDVMPSGIQILSVMIITCRIDVIVRFISVSLCEDVLYDGT
jgi:hypothetical protein